MTRKVIIAVALLAASGATLSACSSANEVEVSSACADSIDSLSRAATNNYLSDEQANAYDLKALDSCSSANEWLTAVLDEPGAIGLIEVTRDQAIDIGLSTSCLILDKPKETAVCSDAVDSGILAY